MAAALVVGLLLAVLVAHGARAQPANRTSSSAVRQLRGSGGGWLPAKATWYGAPNGAGPDDNGMYALLSVSVVFRAAMPCLTLSYASGSAGGACGFKGTNQYPFMSMTSCGNEPLFQDGQGCGACYEVITVKLQVHLSGAFNSDHQMYSTLPRS